MAALPACTRRQDPWTALSRPTGRGAPSARKNPRGRLDGPQRASKRPATETAPLTGKAGSATNQYPPPEPFLAAPGGGDIFYKPPEAVFCQTAGSSHVGQPVVRIRNAPGVLRTVRRRKARNRSASPCGPPGGPGRPRRRGRNPHRPTRSPAPPSPGWAEGPSRPL